MITGLTPTELHSVARSAAVETVRAHGERSAINRR
jgi:hypothetical protein